MKKISSYHIFIHTLTVIIFLSVITSTFAYTETVDEYVDSAIIERSTPTKIPDDIEVVEITEVSPLVDDTYTMEVVSGDIDTKTLEQVYSAPEKISAKPTVIQRITEIVKKFITPKSKQKKKVKLHLANKKTKPVPSSGSIKNGTTKSKKLLTSPSKTDICAKVYDEKKSMTISQSAAYLAPLLTIPQDIDELKRTEGSGYKLYVGAHNRFMCDDPHAPAIPKKAQAAYTTTINWNPTKYPQNYVECVAFVYMSYNMAGIKLPAGLGNAIKWKDKTDVFEVYESGKSSELPREGDVAVWDTSMGEYGHAGVITKVITNNLDTSKNRIEIANANTKFKQLSYPVGTENEKVEIKEGEKLGKPRWWLRKKETHE